MSIKFRAKCAFFRQAHEYRVTVSLTTNYRLIKVGTFFRKRGDGPYAPPPFFAGGGPRMRRVEVLYVEMSWWKSCVLLFTPILR